MHGKKTVMVCDDETGLLQMLEFALRPRYNVLIVNSGTQCIQTFVHEKHHGRTIDILLLDYRLGDMLGDDVARKIRELNGAKVILISAYELGREVVRDLRENNYIIDFIRKPVDLGTIIERIERPT